MSWPIVRLGEVVEINPRLSQADRPAEDVTVTFVPMASVDEDGGRIAEPEIRRFGEVAKGYTTFRDGDVLFAKITPCMENGKAAVASNLLNGVGAGSTEFYVMRPREGVLSEFVFHFVRQERFRQMAKANFTGTAGQQRVPKSFMENAEFPLPPLGEQRRIVDILNRANSIRRLRQEAAAKAREIIPALFVHMFGDPARNPKRFPSKPLTEVADIGSGVTKGRKLDGSETVDLPYMRVANVQDGFLNLTEIKTITVKKKEIERYRLASGDLLMTEGGDPDKLGRAALWSGEIETCLHQNHVFRVRCDRSQILPEFLRALAGSHYGKVHFLSLAKRTTGIASINKTQLSAFPVLLPPVEAQAEFTERITEIRVALARQERAALETDRLRESLLASLMPIERNITSFT